MEEQNNKKTRSRQKTNNKMADVNYRTVYVAEGHIVLAYSSHPMKKINFPIFPFTSTFWGTMEMKRIYRSITG